MPIDIHPQPPFLLWPVSRREFYRAIWVALLLANTWGVIIFGFRPLATLVSASAATTLTHLLLKRWLKWPRAQTLLYHHALVAATIMVALAHPTWPVWIFTAIALLLPLFFALLGGPGRERMHLSIAAVFLCQYLLFPALRAQIYTGSPDAILARDRLVMGDIRAQGPALAVRRWPASAELGGNDAVPFPPPAVMAADTLNRISNVLGASQVPPPAPVTPPGLLSTQQIADIQQLLNRAFAFELPSMEMLMLGAVPNRIGAASLIAITIAGLYLSYRHILQPRSPVIFLATFILVSAALAFTPMTLHRAGMFSVWQTISMFPAEFSTLLIFLILNSDAPFAAVFILALPGTEPLTPRGRRVYLILAAILAAALHRLDPAVPTASLVLTLLMPLAPLFDRALAKPSWLNP